MSHAQPGLSLSVIVPVLNGRDVLARSLTALSASTLARERWELVVVDDGSTDGTRELAAQWADRVIRIDDGPLGPAHARNEGCLNATGDVFVFVDADVMVHPDTLTRLEDYLAERQDVGAVFGTYDDQPAQPGFLSQYRNLLHRFFHLQGAGDTETFWAGCGAVRSDAFRALGGFDAQAFPRPQIEDIELGYRLREAGHRIVILPGVQATHLKAWTLLDILRTDLFDRGIPWMRLILARRRVYRGSGALNVRPIEKLKTALMGLAVVFATGSLLFLDLRWAWGTAASLVLVIVLNQSLYRWFSRRRGWAFTLRAIPLHLLYHLVSGMAVVAGWAKYIGDRLAQKRGSLPEDPSDGGPMPASLGRTRSSRADLNGRIGA